MAHPQGVLKSEFAAKNRRAADARNFMAGPQLPFDRLAQGQLPGFANHGRRHAVATRSLSPRTGDQDGAGDEHNESAPTRRGYQPQAESTSSFVWSHEAISSARFLQVIYYTSASFR
jgi:hypothetical protein